MASQEHWQRVRCVDWLRHRWAFTIRDPATVVGGAGFQVVAEGVDVAAFDSREAAQAWAAEALPSCLAELIASHPELHPAEVVIDSGGRKRLGRIKPELWGEL